MPESIGHRGARWRRSLRGGPAWIILFLLLASCEQEGRHKVLTFFFDGVPPLGGAAAASKSSDPNGTTAGTAPVENWSVHEPVKDCTQCHGRQPRRGFSSKVQLVAEVPQLCHQCHSKFTALEGWVHGPVAAGDCLLCHNPHRTRTEFLLKKPIPELCYQCHEARAIHLIDKHSQPSHAHCTDCHDGHASVTKPLLRPAVAVPKEDARSANPGAMNGESVPALPAAGKNEERPGQDALVPQAQGQDALTTEAAGRDLGATPERTAAELYYRSIKQYHAGKLREAREGFFEALKTGLLPAPMRDTARTYLEKIEEALTESPEPERQLPQ